MSRNSLWMPLYIGDYLADTMELTTLQHGAYLLLLMYQWKRGPLPLDDANLAAIARLEVGQWRSEVRPLVLEFFTEVGGRLVQPRLERERLKVNKISAMRSSAATTTSTSRSKTGNKTGNKPHAKEVTNGQQKEGYTHTHTQEEETDLLSRGLPASGEALTKGEGSDDLWSGCLALITGLLPNKSIASHRSFLGLLVKEAGGDKARVQEAVSAAIAIGSPDPAAYIRARVRSNPSPTRLTDHQRADVALGIHQPPVEKEPTPCDPNIADQPQLLPGLTAPLPSAFSSSSSPSSSPLPAESPDQLRRAWLRDLAAFTSPSFVSQASASLAVYLPGLAALPDESFTFDSLVFVGSRPRRQSTPSYDELAEGLAEYRRQHLAASLKPDTAIPGLSSTASNAVGTYQRMVAEGREPARCLSIIRRLSEEAAEYIERNP